ncbi:hypothetical protein ACJX0J_021125, partial [Zea mays]
WISFNSVSKLTLDSPITEQEGRFIQDNFMLLDITKAFDSVSWPFLIEPIVDKIANQLPGWKADFVLVQSVLTGEAIEDNGWINDIPGSLSRMLWWHQANEAIQGWWHQANEAIQGSVYASFSSPDVSVELMIIMIAVVVELHIIVNSYNTLSFVMD